jgi:hypothetical protein
MPRDRRVHDVTAAETSQGVETPRKGDRSHNDPHNDPHNGPHNDPRKLTVVVT